MLLALEDNKLVGPIKGQKGICPLCKETVISKCGETNVHHWAHIKDLGCDSWSEPESFWHKSWKEAFPIDNREVVIEINNKKHFADIFTKDKVVIELQNSNISSEIIEIRESFYGERMLWLINGKRYRSRISINTSEYPIINSRFNNRNNISSYIPLSSNSINKLIESRKELIFHWAYPIRSWKNAKRPIFLDIGEDYILWIIKGIGTNYGKFKVFRLRDFFIKYGGNYKKYIELNKNERIENYENLVLDINKTIWSFKSSFLGYGTTLELAIKVYNRATEVTCLRKLRWDEPIIPNANNRGLYFLFCSKMDTPEQNGVYINYAIDSSIGSNIKNILFKEIEKELFTIDNNKWIVEFIATIPLKRDDLTLFAKPLNLHLHKFLSKDIIYLNH